MNMSENYNKKKEGVAIFLIKKSLKLIKRKMKRPRSGRESSSPYRKLLVMGLWALHSSLPNMGFFECFLSQGPRCSPFTVALIV